jgi:hypothetical protein
MLAIKGPGGPISSKNPTATAAKRASTQAGISH